MGEEGRRDQRRGHRKARLSWAAWTRVFKSGCSGWVCSPKVHVLGTSAPDSYASGGWRGGLWKVSRIS